MAEDCAAELKCPGRSVAFGLDFHPSRRLLVAGLITGQLRIYSYGEGGAEPATQLAARPHDGACRAVRFGPDGTHLFSCGSDCSVQQRDIETNKPVWRMRRAHKSALNACATLGPHGVGTGCDDGRVHVWDVRQKGAVMKFAEHSDLVTDLYFSLARLQLSASSSDGHLSVYDLRKGRLEALSDELEEELQCLAPLKGGKKLLAGSGSGVIGVFTWGDFGDFSDRLTAQMLGCSEAVEAIAPIDENTALVASADGAVRALALHPSKMLGEVGRHAEPIEALVVDAEAAVAASSAHDGAIRLWDVRTLAAESAQRGAPTAPKAAKAAKGAGGRASAAAGKGGDNDDNSDDDSDEEDEDDRAPAVEAPPPKKLRKVGNAKGPIRLGSDFFADL